MSGAPVSLSDALDKYSVIKKEATGWPVLVFDQGWDARNYSLFNKILQFFGLDPKSKKATLLSALEKPENLCYLDSEKLTLLKEILNLKTLPEKIDAIFQQFHNKNEVKQKIDQIVERIQDPELSAKLNLFLQHTTINYLKIKDLRPDDSKESLLQKMESIARLHGFADEFKKIDAKIHLEKLKNSNNIIKIERLQNCLLADLNWLPESILKLENEEQIDKLLDKLDKK